MLRKLIICTLAFWVLPVTAAPSAKLWSYWLAESAYSQISPDHQAWQQLLDAYLDAQHSSGIYRFDYAAVSIEDQAKLDDYLEALSALDPRSLSRAQQKAYWINLYNALTVQTVLRVYPVESILDIGGSWFSRGPWNQKRLNIAGQDLSLNDIEHRILRPIWRDFRIHFAVNCASLGCPNLLPKAFTVDNTERLLKQAAEDYLQHPRGLRFSADKLRLSKIFDWYGDDFGRTQSQRLQTLARYLGPEKAQRLRAYNGDIDYHYDWALNQP